MQCPKCKTKMYEQTFLWGGGSNENRLSGEKNDKWGIGYTCPMCGAFVDTMPVERSIEDAIQAERQRQADMMDKPRPTDQRRTKTPRPKSATAVEAAEAVAQHAELITERRKLGVTWANLTHQLGLTCGHMALSGAYRKWEVKNG